MASIVMGPTAVANDIEPVPVDGVLNVIPVLASNKTEVPADNNTLPLSAVNETPALPCKLTEPEDANNDTAPLSLTTLTPLAPLIVTAPPDVNEASPP